MKSILILLILLIATSCNKNDINDNDSFPIIFYMYFEVIKSNGMFFDDGEIELSHEMKMENGQITTSGGGSAIWYEMGKSNIASEAMNTTLFGIGPCQPELANCFDSYIALDFSLTSGSQNSGTNDYLIDRYFLIRYNETEMDTLRIRDEKIGGIVNFEFYVNEQLKEVLGNPGLGFSQESPNYIQIQK